MNIFLLELFSEEIPAFMQIDAEIKYKDLFAKFFRKQNISYDDIIIYRSPRRITIKVNNIADQIKVAAEKIKGPSVSVKEQAINGFCKSNNITFNELVKENVNGNQYYFFNKPACNILSVDIIKNNIVNLINGFTWKKSMLWKDYNIKWVRPLHNILCMFNNDIIAFEYGHLKSNNITHGHRFLSDNKKITLNDPKDYEEILEDNFVIIDQKKREQIILNEIEKITTQYNLILNKDTDLLNEIIGIVEYPVILMGQIPKEFLFLPKEILITSMKNHQKYFSLFKTNGNIAPYFIFVANIKSTDENIVISGNEKVLNARLSDALYFYKQDTKKNLSDNLDKLKNVIFHAKLGSLYSKIMRMTKIAKQINPDPNIEKAILLCKNDIISEIVIEFPNLQGIMGYYYALNNNIDKEIAIAIQDHYKPQGINDNLPSNMISAILAIADKLDSICSLFMINEKPTSSKDPYALRRYALGIIRIIIQYKLNINLADIIKYSLDIHKNVNYLNNDIKNNLITEILTFFEERLRNYLTSDFNIQLINISINLQKNNVILSQSDQLEPSEADEQLKESDKLDKLNESNILYNIEKLEYLDKQINLNSQEANHEGKQDIKDSKIFYIYNRIYSIVRSTIKNKKDLSSVINIDNNLFKTESEKSLYKMILDLEDKIKTSNKTYQVIFDHLNEIDDKLEQFFDNNLVNDVDNDLITTNRISMLNKLINIFDSEYRFIVF